MPTAIVIGGASCVWEDVEKARRLFEPDAFLVTNDMTVLWPERIDYMCSLHPEKILEWLNHRNKHGFAPPGEVWSHKQGGPRGVLHRGVDRTTPDWAGSSGLFACKVAIEQDFKKIVVCGVPILANSLHIVRNKHWSAAVAFQSGWKRNKHFLKDKVRSMSGWTKEFLGEPTPEWFASL